jgi:hypothetical protein
MNFVTWCNISLTTTLSKQTNFSNPRSVKNNVYCKLKQSNLQAKRCRLNSARVLHTFLLHYPNIACCSHCWKHVGLHWGYYHTSILVGSVLQLIETLQSYKEQRTEFFHLDLNLQQPNVEEWARPICITTKIGSWQNMDLQWTCSGSYAQACCWACSWAFSWRLSQTWYWACSGRQNRNYCWAWCWACSGRFGSPITHTLVVCPPNAALQHASWVSQNTEA